MTNELQELDLEIARVIAEFKQFGLASQSTCYEIEDRLAALREQRVDLVKTLEQGGHDEL